MNNAVAELSLYLSYPFVINAFIVGVLTALCSSLLGATLVLKRLSFIGDGLAHIAFGAIAIATAFKVFDVNIIVFFVTLAASIVLLIGGENKKLHGDASIAMMSVASLAIGYIVLHLYPTSANIAGDVCTTLFGSTSILTLTSNDVWFSIGLSLFVILMFVLFYHKIFSITFDESFAKATGLSVNLYMFLLAVTISAVIVTAMNLVGSLLIAALIVFPALSSMRIFGSFRAVILSSVVISIFCATLGIVSSILAGTPVGATIVLANLLVFGVMFLTTSFR